VCRERGREEVSQREGERKLMRLGVNWDDGDLKGRQEEEEGEKIEEM
jgi:hypothetical protein